MIPFTARPPLRRIAPRTPRTPRTPRAGRVGAAIAAAPLLLAALATGLGAQQAGCDERAGTLGIQGMRCEGCSFRMSESGLEEARFRTEPEVMAVARGFTRGDRIRPGDRIVAVDGVLITTRGGSDRLVGLRASQTVTLRVRREGKLMDLRMTAGSACELRRAADQGELEVDELEKSAMAPFGARAPLPPPGAPMATPAELPPLPPAAEPPTPAPSGYLGFGIRCSRCGVEGGRFFFSTPPVVESVVPGGPAARAGVRAGEVLLRVDGVDITTPPGARRFAEIEPGTRVRLAVRGGGGEREVTVVAGEPPAPPAPRAAPSAPSAPAAGRAGPVQYRGALGGTRIEVRGAPVRVTRDEETGVVTIHTSDATIVLTSGG